MTGSEGGHPVRVLLTGCGEGVVLALSEPLNAWGGLDPGTGIINHHSHPQRGRSVAGKVLVMPESRGSGTNAQVFAQAWAAGNGPVAVVLAAADYVLCVGAVVSRELYGVRCPVVVADAPNYASLTSGDIVAVRATEAEATLRIVQPTPEPAHRTPPLPRSEDGMSSCANKSGLVTGASGGLGRAIVLDLAADGANVVALGRNIEGLRETAARAHGLAGTAEVLQADVTDEAAVISALAEVERRFGSVDFVVNNAGKQIERDLLDTTNEDWETIDATNVRGPFWVCKHAAAAMLRLGRGGSIVNIASVLSVSADPMLPAYTTSKHAVLGLTRSIAVTRALARAGIRANAVLPGDMDTPMVQQYFAAHEDPEEARRQICSCYPVERIADPAEVAHVVRFLISDDASFVNGASIVVDGGLGAALYTSP